ncbi:DUF87 domain-containing protein [Catellatospora sp. KI3]|uniref:helicase HerA domain-containing protein n=1 Tax=Catellatospora sp. KI3 TaxID=3041620 RepID=UPI002482F890|nr:DUF87 domain-containing protein [Catellatospora sp. KI3]MDI1463304.1 DUF87 domain-containing protein [Catellatospora sp. KI3]
MVELVPGVGRGSLLQRELLDPSRAVEVGGVYRLDYERALVLTADKWKADAGGIPPFCFLLATARDISGRKVSDPDDDEVLLLRVEGVANLAMERDLLSVREEALRQALVGGRIPTTDDVLGIDPYTKERISFTGLDCRILGTFYEEQLDGEMVLDWGHDVDNFYATATYRVYKPIGDGLSSIASYLKPVADQSVQRVRIGVVRYSSTRRRARAAGHADAAVEINVEDFVGQKTGMFGMTRMGKSNTMKTVTARVFMVSERRRRMGEAPIGQLIFDPQGEYANPNTQDGTEIAAIGPNHVSIYKFGADGSQSHVRPLGINFFDPQQIGAVQAMVAGELADSSSGYVQDFAQASFEDDRSDRRATAYAQRGRLALYASLLKAGFKPPTGYSVLVPVKKELREAIDPPKPAPSDGEEEAKEPLLRLLPNGNGMCAIRAENMIEVVQKVIDLREAGSVAAKEFTDDVRWQSTEPIFTGQSLSSRVRGYRNLIKLNRFHNENTKRDVADEIHEDLVAGRVIIVDLHLGAEAVIKRLSEAIVYRLIAKQTEIFTSGTKPPSIQVVVEEAHNLFDRRKFDKDRSDPWVDLAKEAAKLNIGLVYATQEVTGVAHEVLANTKNWVVAHLNNTREVQELSRFYDFAAHADSIIKAEDKGYVRLKTMSSPFIVPVQIDRYGLEVVNEARAVAGESALVPPPTQGTLL